MFNFRKNKLEKTASRTEESADQSTASNWNTLSKVPFAGGQRAKTTGEDTTSDDAPPSPATVKQVLDMENVKNEKFEHYLRDYREENRELLRRIAPDYLLDAYNQLLEEHDSLCIVKLIDRNDDDGTRKKKISAGNGKFSPFSLEQPEAYPTVEFDFAHPENYNFSDENIAETLTHKRGEERILRRKTSFNRLAEKLGFNPEDERNNTKLIATEILAHEFGHAHDYIENYLKPEYKRDQGVDETGLRPEIRAFCRYALMEKEGQLTALKLKTATGERFKAERKCEALDIHHKEELWYQDELRYMDRPTEAAANNFALNYVLKHQEELFGRKVSDLQGWQSYTEEKVGLSVERKNRIDFMNGLGLKDGSQIHLVEHFIGNPKAAPIEEVLETELITPVLTGKVNLSHGEMEVDFSGGDNGDFTERIDPSSLQKITRRGDSYYLGNFEVL